MYKVAGFNPEANNWFWVKAAGDGSAVDAEGALGGCIGCHSQLNNADCLLRYAFGEEPAMPSLSGESSEGEGEMTDGEARSPEELYIQIMGCAGCHNIDQDQTEGNKGAVAPNHGNLHETAGERVAGQDRMPRPTFITASWIPPLTSSRGIIPSCRRALLSR